MASTQFNYYTSYDRGAPILNGGTGSLIDVLDACLVSGYGTGAGFKSGSGWLKPFGNTGSIGCWKQPSGSMCTFLINDSAILQAGTKEAWLFGYEVLHNMSGSFGTGSGQFPHPNQQNSNTGIISGSVIVRKTATFDTTPRPWIIMADDRTVYVWTLTGDVAAQYRGFWFGDIYSYAGPNDTTKCMIHGDGRPNQSTGGTISGMWMDEVVTMANTSTEGLFIQRTYTTEGSSPVQCAKMSDMSWGTLSSQVQMGAAGGVNKYMVSDNSYNIAPVLIIENAVNAQIIRGRFRGMYNLMHGVTGWDDGQTIIGNGAYAGKVFQYIKSGLNGGAWLMEISNTVEYN